ncbi:MAG: hypothetical protein AAF215_26090 [Cyanobacteria bacterium P01_A01_bin.123]
MLKWIRRIALGVVGILLLALLTGLGYEQWFRHSAAQAFPPPGTLVEVNGKFSHPEAAITAVGDVITAQRAGTPIHQAA